jgi:hypothetical protein
MTIKNIIFLDDLLRDSFFGAKRFIYTLIREPILQATGIMPPDPADLPAKRGLLPDFDFETFRSLCGEKTWMECYHSIPATAADYLATWIPHNSLVVGYEMPPWLSDLLGRHEFKWVDIRLSPIRFARDMYVVLRGTIESLQPWIVSEEELRLEAGLMRAAVIHNQSYRSKSNNNHDDAVLFIGQTRADASLIAEDGSLLRVDHFKNEIIDFVAGREIFYKPHPAAGTWKNKEMEKLASITGRAIATVTDSTYGLLAGNMKFDLLTISSGTGQEASFFDRCACSLFQPICDFRLNAHIRFIDFVSPGLWTDALGIDPGHLKVKHLPYVPDSLMRHLHNEWWGYSDYIMENDNNLSEKKIKYFIKKLIKTNIGRFPLFRHQK